MCEIETLRADVASLQARLSAGEHDARCADRERDFQLRKTILDRAVAAVAEGRQGANTTICRMLRLVQSVVEAVHVNGYAIVPGLLSSAEVTRVRENMAPLFATTGRLFAESAAHGRHAAVHIHNVFAKSMAADDVAINPILRAIIGGLLGHDFVFNAGAVAMSPDPGCSAQDLHRDDGSYPVPARPRLPLVVTAAIALDDFTATNGATRLVPGSCWWPADRRPIADEEIACAMAAGSVLLWDGAMFHGGGANVSENRSRRTLTLNYARGWLRTQYNQFLSVPHARVLAMPLQLQNDLGYRLTLRGLGSCDNDDPLAYLRRLAAEGGDVASAEGMPPGAQTDGEGAHAQPV